MGRDTLIFKISETGWIKDCGNGKFHCSYGPGEKGKVWDALVEYARKHGGKYAEQ